MNRQLVLVLLVGGVLIGACGKSDPAPSSSGGGGSDPATTFTITASGVSPRTMTVPRGTQVTFVNNDSRAHDMTSDPHPTHENCPELNSVGLLSAGQRRQSANLNTARTCGFHDHGLPSNTSLQGTITIQ